MHTILKLVHKFRPIFTCVRIFGVRILGVILPRKMLHMFFKFDFVILIELINKKTYNFNILHLIERMHLQE